MLRRLRASLVLCFAVLAGAFLPGQARANTAPVILSLCYSSGVPSQFIGSALTMYMTVVQPTQQMSVSVTSYVAGTNGSITLGCAGFTSLANSTYLYISDGFRTWDFLYGTGDGTSITINNGNLLPNAPAVWTPTDYSLLANMVFTVYSGAPGNANYANGLVTGTNSPGAQVSVDIGQFDNRFLYDNGVAPDLAQGDGIWTAAYTVPNLGYIASGVGFYGTAVVNGTSASNTPFQSAQTANMDMLLPAISSIAVSTSNTNYNGDLYLSSLCQGKSAAVPANVVPTSAQARWDFVVNKPNTVVDITISGNNAFGNALVPKSLPSFVVPNGAASLAGWSVWAGDDGNQNFAYDGVYTASYYIHDINNVTGVTKTAQMKVVSLREVISNINMTPPSIPTEPAVTNGLIANINYKVSLVNDSAGSTLFGGYSGNLKASLETLGWSFDPSQGINSSNNPASTVWTMQTQGTLDPLGNYTQLVPPEDCATCDDDANIASYFLSYFRGLLNNPQMQVPNAESCMVGTPFSNFPAGTFVLEGDGIGTDDWRPQGLLAMANVNGQGASSPGVGQASLFATSTNPITISAGAAATWYGNTPKSGSYRLDLQSQLTGLAYFSTTANPPTTIADSCSPTAGPWLNLIQYHFFPQSRIDEPSGNACYCIPQGDGISTMDTSYIFTVQSTTNPTGDNTPPQFLFSNPAANSTVAPNAFSNTSPLSAQFQDPNSPINTQGSVTYIKLLEPNGSTFAGSSSTNGGGPDNTITVSFAPQGSISIGGVWTMEVFICSTAGLCEEQVIPFTVQDWTAPSIPVSSGVALYTQQTGTSANYLSLYQNGPQGPFQNVTGISVTMTLPNTTKNTLDTTDSNVSLYQISGTSKVPVPMTQQPWTNVSTSGGTANYTLNNIINTNGRFEIDTQTFSQDASGNKYVGPPSLGTNGTNDPQFTTELCTTCMSYLFQNDPNPNLPAMLLEQPVTVTTQSVAGNLNLGGITIAQPASLPPDPGFTRLATAKNCNQIQFFYNTTALTTPLTFNYSNAPLSVTAQLYYDQADLTLTGSVLTNSQLKARGYDGSSWNTITGSVVQDATPNTGDSFTITLPTGKPAYVYYAIAYAASLSITSGTPFATPVSFNNTRAFNPDNPNAAFRQARFYYSSVQPSNVEARIFDTSGHLIKDLTLGNGIQVNDFSTDPVFGTTQYWFAWDGTNDGGTVVHNGLYLVRWTYSGIDGSAGNQTKPVALIK